MTPTQKFAPLPPLPRTPHRNSLNTKIIKLDKRSTNSRNQNLDFNKTEPSKSTNANSISNSNEGSLSRTLKKELVEPKAYSFISSGSVSAPKFINRKDSYKRHFQNRFNKEPVNLRSLDSLKKEHEFKQFLLTDEDSQKKYFYSKYQDIYENEKRK